MAKTRVLGLMIVAVMLLAAVLPFVTVPRFAEAYYTTDNQPVNYSPYDGATEIGPSFVFQFQVPSAYPDEYTNFQVQYCLNDTFSQVLYDSGILDKSVQQVYPAGMFDYEETYYWRVRVQDNRGYWTGWSDPTSFTVIGNSPPGQPENFEPDDGATGVPLPVTLAACEFRDPNADELVLGDKDTHVASQWQVRTAAGSYAAPLLGASLTASTIAFADNGTITDTGNGLAIFKAGDTIAVTGSALNNGLYTVVEGGAAGSITVSEALKTEAAGASVSINSVTTTFLTSLNVAMDVLVENSVYYWRVRYQDSYGNWSPFSPETSFKTGTTAVVPVVQQPVNVSPFNGAVEVSPDQKLGGSAFVSSLGRTHLASRWQIARAGANEQNLDGSYAQPIFDSTVDFSNKTQIAMPVGLVDYGKTYFWHVKYQDDTGAWSAWSAETYFTVVQNLPPSSPRNVDPLDAATGVSAMPTLTATGFSDPDATAYVSLTDSHSASQWQVRSSSGTYDSPVLNSVTGPATSIMMLSQLQAGTTYYWHVRYQDSRGNWSGYSEETSFTTKAISVPVAAFVADMTDVVAGQDLVTFTESSTPASEIDSWVWDFGDGATESWTHDTRPPNGEVTHKYTTGGTYTVTLTVYNGAATAGVALTMEIVVHAKPVAGFTMTPALPKAGKEITFTDASTETADIESWEWAFDDGTTETWTSANRPADGQIKHTFKKGGDHTVSLIVKGKGNLGESFYNKKFNVKGAGGFQFALWMVAVGVGVVVVIAGAVYLVRARKGK